MMKSPLLSAICVSVVLSASHANQPPADGGASRCRTRFGRAGAAEQVPGVDLVEELGVEAARLDGQVVQRPLLVALRQDVFLWHTGDGRVREAQSRTQVCRNTMASSWVWLINRGLQRCPPAIQEGTCCNLQLVLPAVHVCTSVSD